MNTSPTQSLVLAGAGHANSAVIAALIMRPNPAVRLIVIHPQGEATYSGMLPAVVARDHAPEALAIDIQALTERAGGWFIRGEVTGVDAARHHVMVQRPDWLGGQALPPIHFDHLLINTGAEPGDPFPTVHPALYSVKPLSRFLDQLPAMDAQVQGGHAQSLGIVGGGAAGIELAFAARRRFGPSIRIMLVSRRDMTADPLLRPGANAIRKSLARHRIEWLPNTDVIRVSASALECADGRSIAADLVWVSTPVQPAAWLAETPLMKCEMGFLQVNASLQCLGYPRIYAAGDVASLPVSRPRSGVMAVRAGQYLARHLTQLLAAVPLPPFRPQKRWLTLLNTGDGRAIAIRGHWVIEGAWVARWKHWIDTRFIKQFRMPSMASETMHCEGCAAKLPGRSLHAALRRTPFQDAESMAVGSHTLAMTIDGLTHCLSDPELMGRLALRHAASDLFAAGGRDGAVLNCIGVQRTPHQAMMDTEFQWVLHGITEEAKRLGLASKGGHVLSLDQSMIAIAATGSIHATLDKTQVRAGDAIWITGPIGTGLLFAGIRQGLIPGRASDQFFARWLQSPPLHQATAVALELGATAMTDVSGYGVAGHLSEMLGDHAPSFAWNQCPVVYPEVADVSQRGLQSSAFDDNWEYAHPSLRHQASAACFDPQTGGPLLIAIPQHLSSTLDMRLRSIGFAPVHLGDLVDKTS